MASTERQDSGTFSAFITGALVGAGIALLLAPHTGENMRGAIRDFATRAKDGLDEAVDSGAEAWQSVKARGADVIEKGKASVRDAGHQVKEAVEGTKQAVYAAKDDLTSKYR